MRPRGVSLSEIQIWLKRDSLKREIAHGHLRIYRRLESTKCVGFLRFFRASDLKRSIDHICIWISNPFRSNTLMTAKSIHRISLQCLRPLQKGFTVQHANDGYSWSQNKLFSILSRPSHLHLRMLLTQIHNDREQRRESALLGGRPTNGGRIILLILQQSPQSFH